MRDFLAYLSVAALIFGSSALARPDTEEPATEMPIATLGAPEPIEPPAMIEQCRLDSPVASLGSPQDPVPMTYTLPMLPSFDSYSAPPEVMSSSPAKTAGPHLWARSEFLSFWFKNGSAPPLATTGPANTLPVIGQPGTVVLFGNTLDSPTQFGGRFTVGGALPWGSPYCDRPACGFELSYFFVSPNGGNFFAASPGVPLISRPFFDVSSGVPVSSVEGVANPAGLGIAPVRGSLTITDPSSLYGFEANFIHNLCCDPCKGLRLDLLYGFRQVALQEGIGINENLTLTDGSGEHIVVNDNFSTNNQFFGGQIGLRAEQTCGRFFINATAKVALGDMIQQVNISGSTTDSLPGSPTVTAPGGLLAQSTNSGRHFGNSFCVIPEAQFNVGWNVTSWLRAFVGYDFLFISDVVRPGNQIDPFVNTNLLPGFAGGKVLPPTPGGPYRPAFQMNRTDFWAQGVTAGVQLSW